MPLLSRFRKTHLPSWAENHAMWRCSRGFLNSDLLWCALQPGSQGRDFSAGYILSPELRKEFVPANRHPAGLLSFAALRTNKK